MSGCVITRDQLLTGILEFLGDRDLLTAEDIRTALQREIDDAGPEALLALKDRLTADRGWQCYPRDPLARRIHHLLADRFLRPDSDVSGLEHATALATARVAIFSNHLSYADANVIEVLLQREGATLLADRLTVVAGPKVFTSRQRRFSSLCFNTVRVPQSADVSSGEAVLRPREIAAAARRSIELARSRLTAGEALLLFPEGTRSRSGAMQPMLPAVARYLEVPDTRVLPVALTGPEALFPVDATSIQPARVRMRVGPPFAVEALASAARGDRRTIKDAIGLAIAELLPCRYRGYYEPADRFARARAVLATTRTPAAPTA